MKEDEQRLLNEIRNRESTGEIPYVRGIVRDLGINENRAAYICEKWTRKGWYEYGVNVLAGWLTDAAPNFQINRQADHGKPNGEAKP